MIIYKANKEGVFSQLSEPAESHEMYGMFACSPNYPQLCVCGFECLTENVSLSALQFLHHFILFHPFLGWVGGCMISAFLNWCFSVCVEQVNSKGSKLSCGSATGYYSNSQHADATTAAYHSTAVHRRSSNELTAVACGDLLLSQIGRGLVTSAVLTCWLSLFFRQ